MPNTLSELKCVYEAARAAVDPALELVGRLQAGHDPTTSLTPVTPHPRHMSMRLYAEYDTAAQAYRRTLLEDHHSQAPVLAQLETEWEQRRKLRNDQRIWWLTHRIG